MSARHALVPKAVGVVAGVASVVAVEVVALVVAGDAGHSNSTLAVNMKPMEVGCMMQPTSTVYNPQRTRLTE
jgi:hypothetical protein